MQGKRDGIALRFRGRFVRSWLERRRDAQHIVGMPSGKEIFRKSPPAWEEGGGSCLLLNPRTPTGWREKILAADFPDLQEHFWLATSGTRGSLKIVALSRSAMEASARAVNTHLGATSDDVWINPLPLFHVGGLGILIRAAVSGARWELFEKWDPPAFAERASGATLTSLVPAQVHDLVRSGVPAPGSLRAAVVGGGALGEDLRWCAARLGWPLLPSYGLTEACSQVATAAPGSADPAWLPLLPHIEARTSAGGVLELQGASLLSGWMIFDANGAARWEDPKVEGWLRTSDRAELRGRSLQMLGRVDDLVKIRGELVDLGALERSLQERVPSGAVCLRASEDARNGFVLDVLAENTRAAEESRAALDVFPPYARPAAVEVGTVARTPLGKIIRGVAQ